MSVSVEPGDPRDPQAASLLQASHALMQSLYPPEDNHYLSLDALTAPGIRFFTARHDGRVVGCAALALKDSYAEIKSMYVAETARGSGAADALMQRLEVEARAAGFAALKLETGNTLHAAHRLYARHGFAPCDRFGDYPGSPSSLFMAKPLA